MHRSSKVEAPAELLAYLFATWPDVKKKQIRTWLKFQAVMVNGRPITRFNHRLCPGDEVAIRPDRFAIPMTTIGKGMKVYFEDADVIVVDKPEGLLSIASQAEQTRTVYYQIADHLRRTDPRPGQRIWIVHRLDRETSGLMVLAKTAEAQQSLQRAWGEVDKRYEAVVEGRMPRDSGTLTSDLDETNPYRVVSAPRSSVTRAAVTHYRVLARSRWRSLVELRLETGRRHQIRVQLTEAGFPIVGDGKYNAKSDPVKRLGLHACRLAFRHPRSGETLSFESPLPRELARLV